MSNSLISFRFSKPELEILEKNRLEGESLSLCAARLLRESLGITEVNNAVNSLTKPLADFVDDIVTERLSVILDSQQEANRKYHDEFIQPMIDRLDAIESQITKPRSARSKKNVATNLLNSKGVSYE
jgi:hypothetical protein